MADPNTGRGDFEQAVAQIGPRLLRSLGALEAARRSLHPPDLPELRRRLRPLADQLTRAKQRFAAAPVPSGLEGFAAELGGAAGHAARALVSIAGAEAPPGGADGGGITGVLEAMHAHHRAEASLFSLRRALPPVNQFFFEAPVRDRIGQLDPDEPPNEARVGLHNVTNSYDERGGFSLYVPESYDGSEDWPLVVALHGGSGHGADFLWSWLREARSRRFVLLSPTSVGSTWSLHAPSIDSASLRSMVAAVKENWRIDSDRVLVTGLSDGATFSLLCGLEADSPFTAIAPVSGVLHPANFANGNMDRAAGRRIWLVHGALDWLFPVQLARDASDALLSAGASLVYREIEDLSHTYPREENAQILSWFDSKLALPSP